MFKNIYLRTICALALAVLLALAGCATVEVPWRSAAPIASPELRAAVEDCAQYFETLDAVIERAGVRDAEARRVAGFPYVRVDRLGASLRDAAGRDDKAYQQWLSYLQALDQNARRVEISNLPDMEVRVLLPGNAERSALLDKTARCGDLLREQDQLSAARAALIRERAQVPDNYVTWQRVAGLYELTQLPFARGIAQWHSEALRDFQNGPSRNAAHPIQRYAPGKATTASSDAVAAILRRASDNPLRLPQFNDVDKAVLVNTYAPVFEVETGGAYDRIGRLQWGTGVAPQVDIEKPVVYHRIAYTRYGDAILTQIVYTAWFPERPHDHALDLLAGRLDGVVIRVTLGPQGEPLLYDSIHPCGCYHMFFPTARVQAVPAPDGAGEWAFVPATLPAHGAGTRLAVRLASRTHYVTGVAIDAPGGTDAYALLPEDDLRTLPTPTGTRSAYGPDGLVPGTQRAERMLFWPMGIPSAGAMRQWGHHATAFVGRRHFDDADLIEKRFRLLAP